MLRYPPRRARPVSTRATSLCPPRTMTVAVFLPNWSGDAGMATPALRALRTHFRGLRMVGVVKPYVAGLLEGGDWFDELILAHGGPWAQSVPAVAWKLRQ